METVRFFERLGFKVHYTGKSERSEIKDYKKAELIKIIKPIRENNKNIPDIEKIDTIKNNLNKGKFKIRLYLQTDELKTFVDFQKTVEIIKKSDFDIFVLPEFSYVPFYPILRNADVRNPADRDNIYKRCLEFSEAIGKAVVISSEDRLGIIYSVYANAFADITETSNAIYIKHTMTSYSAFQLEDYREITKTIFEPIIYKDYKIGMTICYDCNHSLFTRVYGLKDVDVILNSTGGDVVYGKWYKYNKVRAIENNCYNFVTMGGEGRVSNSKAYVYAFNRYGKQLKAQNILSRDNKNNSPGGVYVYDISLDDGCASPDTSLYQNKTPNKNYHLSIPIGNIDSVLNKSIKVDEDIYIYKVNSNNVVFLLIEENDILKPERVLSLLYSKEINQIDNKRYIIVNKHEKVDKDSFENIFSVVLKVRSMENFCAVILESENINECYQSGKNRTAQVLKAEDGMFNIDLTRTTGPEAIWKNKNGMRADWRENFEWLIENMKSI